MLKNPLECTVFSEKLPAKLGKQCPLCRECYPLSKFERRRWVPEKEVGERVVPGYSALQEGTVCHKCQPLSAWEALDFERMAPRELSKAAARGLVTGQKLKWVHERVVVIKKVSHAEKIGGNRYRAWSAPWIYAIGLLSEELVWARQRRRYLFEGVYKGPASGNYAVDNFFSRYCEQLIKMRGFFELQSRRFEGDALTRRVKAESFREGYKVLTDRSKWSDYMFDKDRYQLDQLYWTLLKLDGGAMGEHLKPLLLDTSERQHPLVAYAGPETVSVPVSKKQRRQSLARLKVTAEIVRARLSYDPSNGHLTWRSYKGGRTALGKRAGTVLSNGHRVIGIEGVSVASSHVVWLHCKGCWPEKTLYRVNEDESDDRIENLQEGRDSFVKRDDVSGAHTFGGTT